MSDKLFRMRAPPRAEILYDFVQEPVFPFRIIEFEEENNITNPVTKIKVNKELYSKIVKDFGTNRMIFYCNLSKDFPISFNILSPNIQNSISILKDLKLIATEEEWILKSQEDIIKAIKEEE